MTSSPLTRGGDPLRFAKAIGADIQRVSKYERGVNVPTTDIMVRIADTLDVSLDYLLRNGKNGALGKIRDMELIDGRCFDCAKNFNPVELRWSPIVQK
jgi:transcriptional regulator with XRE-family HTH domain